MMRPCLINFCFFLFFLVPGIWVDSARARAEGFVHEKGVLPLDLEKLNSFLGRPGPKLERQLDSLLAPAVDYELLSVRTFGSYCEDTLTNYEDRLEADELLQLVGSCKENMVAAYRRRLVADLAALLRKPMPYQLQVGDRLATVKELG